MTLTIRPIAPDEALTIAQIHIASWRDAYRGVLREEYLASEVVADRTAVWTERFNSRDPRCFGFIAELVSEPAGFIFLHGAADETWGTLLDNLHVLPEHKRRGIGLRLIEAAARETLARHPHEQVHLWVFEANIPARRFYEKLEGQEVERTIVTAPGGGSAPACRVAWTSPQRLLNGVARLTRR